jgi:hypothetical protein
MIKLNYTREMAAPEVQRSGEGKNHTGFLGLMANLVFTRWMALLMQ